MAWNGTDSDTGSSVEINGGNTVRAGHDIDVYDDDVGEYRSMSVDSVQRIGNTVEVEVTDNDSGESRTLDMDGDE
jgi:hypothetical protein